MQHTNIRDKISHIRKGDISFSLVTDDRTIRIETDPVDATLVKSILYEVIVQLDSDFEQLKVSC